jgi:hypothetical protein
MAALDTPAGGDMVADRSMESPAPYARDWKAPAAGTFEQPARPMRCCIGEHAAQVLLPDRWMALRRNPNGAASTSCGAAAGRGSIRAPVRSEWAPSLLRRAARLRRCGASWARRRSRGPRHRNRPPGRATWTPTVIFGPGSAIAGLTLEGHAPARGTVDPFPAATRACFSDGPSPRAPPHAHRPNAPSRAAGARSRWTTSGRWRARSGTRDMAAPAPASPIALNRGCSDARSPRSPPPSTRRAAGELSTHASSYHNGPTNPTRS